MSEKQTSAARDGKATRAMILAMAQAQFGAHGFDRTTIRSIASAAGVDPALVMYYFGSKAELFSAASRLNVTFPELSDVPSERLVDVLLPVFVDVWRSDGPFLSLLRAAATNRNAAETLLSVLVEQVTPALGAVAPDRAAERAALVGSQLLGIVVAREIVGVPALQAMDELTLAAWLRPVLAHYLTDPGPASGNSPTPERRKSSKR